MWIIRFWILKLVVEATFVNVNLHPSIHLSALSCTTEIDKAILHTDISFKADNSSDVRKMLISIYKMSYSIV